MLIWTIDEKGEWDPVELEGAVKVGRTAERLRIATSEVEEELAALFPWKDPIGRLRHLLIPERRGAKVAVNGYPILELKLLADKDEVSFGAGPLVLYYSEESPPRKIRFEGASEKPLFCVRCKDRIEAGEEIVVCPKCRLYYHETEGRGCWMYDAACAGCRRPTGIDYTWRPEPIRIRKRGYAQ